MISAIILAACLQTGFDPSKLGIRNPGLERRAKAEAVRVKAVAAPPKRVVTPARTRRRVVRVAPKPPAKPVPPAKAPARPAVPPSYLAVVPVVLEDVPQGSPAPKLKWIWFVDTPKEPAAKRGGEVALPAEDPVPLPNLIARSGFVKWQIVGEPEDWEIVEGERIDLPAKLGEGEGWEGRRWSPEAPVVLRRTRVDVLLIDVPEDAVIRFGEEILPARPTERGLALSLPRAYAEAEDATLEVEHSEAGATRRAEVELRNILGPASPYRTFLAPVHEHMWRLEGLPNIQLRGLDVFDRVDPRRVSLASLPQAEDVFDAYGDPDRDEPEPGRTTFGIPDGSRLWSYDRLGLEVKIREVMLADGSPARVVERIALTAPGAGSVADVRVGDASSKLGQRFGKPELGDPVRFEGAGYRAYLGGGLAFMEDVPRGEIARIEIRRPLAYLREGLVPSPMPDPRFARVVDVDHRAGKAVLELPEGSPAKLGSRFEIRNLEAPAIPEASFKGPVVALIESLEGRLATVRLQFERDDGFNDLERADAQRAVKNLLDPALGFTWAVLRA